MQAQEAATCVHAAAQVAKVARPTIVDSSATARGLFRCRVSGPAQIARLWLQPNLSAAELLNLRAYTSGVLDQRIADALSAIAHRSSAASETRQSALAVLAGYINPAMSSSPDVLRVMGRDLDDAYVTDGGVAFFGSVPTTPRSRRAIVRLFAELSFQAGDRGVQEVARAAFRGANAAAPELIEIPGGAITIQYVCGNRFRVRNTTPLDLRLRYEVAGTADSREWSAAGAAESQPHTEVIIHTLRRGAVSLYFRDQQLHTAANDGKICSG